MSVTELLEDKKSFLDESLGIYSDQGVCKFLLNSEIFSLFSRLKKYLDNEDFPIEALEISTKIIELTPQHYTAWYFRRKIIERNFLHDSNDQNSSFLKKELFFVRNVCEKNPKCYQNWWHMRKVREWIGFDVEEFNYINKILSDDTKNMYAWSHRYWFFRKFNCEKDFYYKDLNYVSSLIMDDCRNNSAWCFRYFIFDRLKKMNEIQDYDLIEETDYIMRWLKFAPHNDSIWNYIIAFFSKIITSDEKNKTFHGTLSFKQAPLAFKNLIDELFNEHKLSCHQLVYIKACIAFEEGQEHLVSDLLRILQITDPIRRFYWRWRLENLNIEKN